MNPRLTVALFVATTSFVVSSASAQSRVELSVYPRSHVRATQGESTDQPRFRTNLPGGTVTVNLTPRFAVEADVAGSRGNVQSIGAFGQQRSPAMTSVGVSAVLNLAPRQRVQPYATVGVASMHIFKRPELGIQQGETFDSANVGGGTKIMFGQWGVRADYRFVGMDSTATERSVFVGPGTRHAHRFSLGFVIAPGR